MGGLTFHVENNVGSFDSRVTASVIITCIVAASGGLIFGYDIGVSGGVATMEPFLAKFFPSLLRKLGSAKRNAYCRYDSQVLTAFTSSLYMAGLVSCLVASNITRRMGRKATMILGGCTFFFGSAVNGGASNVVMLILGRILLGFGVGFTCHVTPVYLSEMAPSKWRGAFNFGFMFFLGTGILIANVVNFHTSRLGNYGWRISLGLGAVPAALMTLGGLLLSDTPSSLVQRGKIHQARQSLKRVRGVESDVEAELNELIQAAQVVNKAPFKTIFERQFRPHLVIAVLIPFFQQVGGINVIAFYAPVLFHSVGFGRESALLAAIILGLVNLSSIVLSMFVVDRYGRRVLFLEGGVQMLVFKVAVACVIAAKFGLTGDQALSKGDAVMVLVFICLYTAAFGWSWGPLSALIPSEIFPMEIRPAGQSISVVVNFATTFILSQAFLSMLCHLKFGAFLFYAGWIAVMTIFVGLFLPETKGIPLESMHIVWERHWYWRRFVQGASKELPKEGYNSI